MDKSKSKSERILEEQVGLLITEYRQKGIDVHDFVRLVDITYKDFLDFHPEEREKIYARFKSK